MLEDHPKHPFRRVDWRWARAGAIASGAAKLSRRRDDAHVARAARFRRRLAACRDAADYCALAEAEPDLYWAHELYAGDLPDAGGSGEGPGFVVKHTLEARLLACQGHAEAAGRCGIDPGVVAAYEATFFDVAGRHDHIDYIAATVMGPAFYRGARARRVELLWKLFAWGYGPALLDAFLTSRVARLRPDDPQGIRAALGDIRGDTMRLRGVHAAQTVNIAGDQTALMLLAECNRLDEIERGAGGAAGGQQTLLVGLGACMSGLPFRVGGREPPEAVAGRPLALAAFDESAAEPRGEELVQMGAGLGAPAYESERALAFPEPERRAAPG